MNVPYGAVGAYKQTQVRTASQGKLIVMLYDEALRQLDLALDLMKAQTRQLDKVHNALIKTQDIVTELMAGLDFEQGGDIAKNLFSLYLYFNEKLKEGNIRKDSDPVAEVRGLVSELRGAWLAIMPKVGHETGRSAESGVNIAG